MSEGVIELSGAHIAYSDEGHGPLVIRAHGLTSSRRAERALGLVDWQELSNAGFRLISYDARGHGYSTGTNESDSYRWDRLADDLLAIIDHFSPTEPVHAVGISMGTGTIVHALTRAPERFASVALGAPPTAWQTRSGQASGYGEMAAVAERSTPEDFRAMVTGGPAPQIFADVQGYPAAPDIPHHLIPAVLRGAGASDLPPADVVAEITTPALVLAWDGDAGHPVSTAESLAQLLPVASLHISTTAADIGSWAAKAADFFAGRPR